MRHIRIGGQGIRTGRLAGKLPLGSVFLAGFIAGVVIMNLGKSILLENTGLLDEYTLYHMKYMTVDSSALFYFVLRKRLGNMLVLVILATTYLGLAVCAGAAFWYGMSAGAFLTALLIRYGLKGILFALAGVFPQYLLYAPALAALLLWCEEINRSIYFRNYSSLGEGKYILPGKIVKLVFIFCIILLGCMLESFCNPHIMLALLKIF